MYMYYTVCVWSYFQKARLENSFQKTAIGQDRSVSLPLLAKIPSAGLLLVGDFAKKRKGRRNRGIENFLLGAWPLLPFPGGGGGYVPKCPCAYHDITYTNRCDLLHSCAHSSWKKINEIDLFSERSLLRKKAHTGTWDKLDSNPFL